MDRKAVLEYSTQTGLDFDYALSKRNKKELVNLTKNIKRRLKEKLLPKLNVFNDFNIVFISDMEEYNLGEYVNGSYQTPIVLLNLKSIKQNCKQHNVNVACGIETTILHELAHGIQDYCYLEFDEEEAEDFAYDYFTYGIINFFWRKKK